MNLPELSYVTRQGKSWYPGCIGHCPAGPVFLFSGSVDEYLASVPVAEEAPSSRPVLFSHAGIIDGKGNLVWEGTPDTYNARPAVQPGQKLVGMYPVGNGV